MKCPFCKRNAALIDAANDGKFCLAPTADCELKLKAIHQYYYQVQMQIFVCQKDLCDLVVWTEDDIHLERLEPNAKFWASTNKTATCFFRDVLLLELVKKFFSHPSSCHCQLIILPQIHQLLTALHCLQMNC